MPEVNCQTVSRSIATGGRPARREARAAFTLVELMMSLVIIGILVSLLGVAVGYAIRAAKRTQVKVEISNLDAALQTYKNQFGGEYPPCMAFAANTPLRIDLFNRAFRKRFPRSTLDYTSAAKLLYSGDVGVNPVNNWRVKSINNSQNVLTLDIKGSISRGLDPAEALVFWLAGPPTPLKPGSITETYAATTLYGFSSNPTNPFQMTGGRQPFLYDFDESRLTDVDNDGWPEYVPPITSNKTVTDSGASNAVAPYVYFDAASYLTPANASTTLVASYPGGSYATPNVAPNAAIPQGPLFDSSLYGTAEQEFGRAVPYPTHVSNAQPLIATFWNPKKFQIICAGSDNEYGGSIYEPPVEDGSSGGRRPFMPQLPQKSSDGMPVLLVRERDNMTNFIDAVLEDYVPQ